MKKDRFIENLRDEIMRHMPKEISEHMTISVASVTKQNDTELCGLSFCCDDKKTSDENIIKSKALMFYVEGLYEEFKKGESIEAIAKQLAQSYVKYYSNNKLLPDLNRMIFDEEKLYSFMVLEKKRNSQYLKDVPFKDLGNGLVAAGVIVYSDDEGTYSAIINYSLLNKFGISEDEFFDIAMRDAEKNMPAVLRTLDYPLIENSDNLLQHSSALLHEKKYVLTNIIQRYGAAALFYRGMKERIAEKLGESYYILPSSLHEVIILPYDESIDPCILCKMVKEVNLNIDKRDILCDNVFLYNIETKEMTSYITE